MNIEAFWTAVLNKDRTELRKYFNKDAIIRWHCSSELFTMDEFIRVNCDYPGEWAGTIERIEETNGLIICAVRVYSKDERASFHVVSFARINDGLISELDEYWSDDAPAPEWRQEMGIGRPMTRLSDGNL